MRRFSVESARDYIQDLMGKDLEYNLPIDLTLEYYPKGSYEKQEVVVNCVKKNSEKSRPRFFGVNVGPVEFAHCLPSSLIDEVRRLQKYIRAQENNAKMAEIKSRIRPWLGEDLISKLSGYGIRPESINIKSWSQVYNLPQLTEALMNELEDEKLSTLASEIDTINNYISYAVYYQDVNPDELSFKDKAEYYRLQRMKLDWKVDQAKCEALSAVINMFSNAANWKCDVPVLEGNIRSAFAKSSIDFIESLNVTKVYLTGTSSNSMEELYQLISNGWKVTGVIDIIEDRWLSNTIHHCLIAEKL